MTPEQWEQHIHEMHGKSQPTRLMDVFVLGPLMIYAGQRLRRHGDPWLGAVIIGSGIGTILYNYRNWRRLRWLAEK